MRTTLTIDEDIFLAAKEIAKQKNSSIGKIISELARKGVQAKPIMKRKGGVPVFSVSKDAKVITLDDVKKLEDLL